MTSLMDAEFVNIMTSLSMPIPSPPAGGMPYSRALRNPHLYCAFALVLLGS